jgi:hypothetical protein
MAGVNHAPGMGSHEPRVDSNGGARAILEASRRCPYFGGSDRSDDVRCAGTDLISQGLLLSFCVSNCDNYHLRL